MRRERWTRGRVAALWAAAALALAPAVGVDGSGAGPADRRGVRSGPGALAAQSVPAGYVRAFFGAVHLDAGKMHLADDVGATWGRLGLQWRRHEPEPGVFDFARWDTIVGVAREHGVLMLPVLNQVPEWASSAPPDATERWRYAPSDEGMEGWQEYVRRVVERYPEIEYFEIWNEPNIDWFLRADENYRVYVDRILIPAAEVIHAAGRKVVAPSYTLEWPADSWPLAERPSRLRHTVAAVTEDVDRWLSYHDAWRHIDILSVHYSKGDTEKPMLPHAQSLMPFYDHVYEHWIRPGKLEGVWNTEAGLTAVEAGTRGFVSLEPWERPPYAQWVPRYMLPVLHWALGADWKDRHQYKASWYHMKAGPGRSGTLLRTNLLDEAPDGPVPSDVGRAMRTLSDLLAGDAGTVGQFDGGVEVGFGLFDDSTALNYFAPYRFRSYAFQADRDVIIATWLDLPGLEFATGVELDVVVAGLGPGSAAPPERGPAEGSAEDWRVTRIDYITGETTMVGSAERLPDGRVRIRLPAGGDPVLYLRLAR
ncbi:MAG: hypothetical protein R6U63_05510 [Longimicrobiales bacterium]